ncbi:MAG: NAAT family transporter [Candidatus Eremiobacteraeota bacterium]|nr:NAAT family transporter [Candidatus Eremiobacteraeota bacterium]
MDFVKTFTEGPFGHGLIFVVLSLIPIVNPLGMAPIFLEYTQDLDNPTTRRLARRVAINGFFLAAASLLVGPFVLEFFGISLAAVRIAGGLVIAFAGWRLLNQSQDDARERMASVSAETAMSRAFYPLTLPLTIGPGSIAVLLTVGSNIPYEGAKAVLDGIGAIVGIAVTCLAVYLCYSRAEPILKRLGRNGVTVVLRLSAFILLCIGVQIMIEGIRSIPALAR